MKKQKLAWKNLQENTCPKCKAPLAIQYSSSFMHEKMHQCTSVKCDFRIRHSVFEKVVEDLYKPKMKFHD